MTKRATPSLRTCTSKTHPITQPSETLRPAVRRARKTHSHPTMGHLCRGKGGEVACLPRKEGRMGGIFTGEPIGWEPFFGGKLEFFSQLQTARHTFIACSVARSENAPTQVAHSSLLIRTTWACWLTASAAHLSGLDRNRSHCDPQQK